jgi:hypothetical protein
MRPHPAEYCQTIKIFSMNSHEHGRASRGTHGDDLQIELKHNAANITEAQIVQIRAQKSQLVGGLSVPAIRLPVEIVVKRP